MRPHWEGTTNFQYDYYSLTSVFDAYQKQMPKVVGFPFNYRFENGIIYYDENNFAEHVRRLQAKPATVEKQIRWIETVSGELLAAAKKYGTQSGVAPFKAWHRVFLKFLPSLGIVIGLERVLAAELKSFLSPSDFLDVSLSKETATTHEQRALFALAAKQLKGDALSRAVAAHVRKYSWIGNKLMTWHPFTVGDISQRLVEIGNQGKKKLAELERNRAELEQSLRKVTKRLKPEQKKLVALYRDLLYWRSGRAEALMQSASLTEKMFLSLGAPARLTRPEVTCFSADELLRISAGTLKPHLAKRKVFYGWVVDGRTTMRLGHSGRVLASKASTADVVTGTPANRGTVRGRVAVVIGPADFGKVKKGDVLVAYGTNPNMVVVMERAAAFVTDLGSLTSHTAIIAREMGVPAIVACKNATQVLKDGDLVEVDGAAGTVTILKKQKR